MKAGTMAHRKSRKLHCVDAHHGEAACTYGEALTELMDAAMVPLEKRCQRQGCKQLWPEEVVEDFL